MRRSRSRPRAALAALALSTATLGMAITAIITVLPAQAESPTTFGPAGQLVLKTTGADRVEYYSPGAQTPDQVQTLTTSGTCNLTSAGNPLLQFSGTVDTTPPKSKGVGLRNDSIGVIESSLSALCNRVDVISLSSTETLELKLNPAFKSFAGNDMFATKASLDVEVRSWLGSKAKIEATPKLNGEPVGTSPFTLTQASTVPDDTNLRFDIQPTGKFDSISLKALKGSFSLEGGSDAGAAATTFDLVTQVDAVLNCTAGSTYTEGNTTVRRLGDADGSECAGFGVKVTAGDQAVQLLKPLHVAPTAQFIFDIDWHLPAPAGPGVQLPTPKVDFELVPNVEVPRTLTFCPSYLYDGSGALVGAVEPGDLTALQAANVDMESSLAGPQYACVGLRSATVAASGTTVSDKLFLIGDARFRF